jgi:Asp-tRNA(Asn)/Glu-tRNA(Gln) amidotransferase A subunit family amidase
MSDLAERTATELIELYATGQASPVEATKACLERIEATDPAINAILLLLEDTALAQAAQSAERWQRGTARPLEGVPYGLKDIIATPGVTTTGGSALYRDWVPERGAVLADRLAEAGGVLIAKLQTFEGACGGAANKTYGRRSGGRDGPPRDRDGHRRLDPHPGCLLRHHRSEAHVRPGPPRRRDGPVVDDGPRRADDPLGA